MIRRAHGSGLPRIGVLAVLDPVVGKQSVQDMAILARSGPLMAERPICCSREEGQVLAYRLQDAAGMAAGMELLEHDRRPHSRVAV